MLSATSAQVRQPSSPVKLQRLRLTKEEFRASIPQSTCPKRCAVSRQKRLEVAASPCNKVVKTPPVQKLSATAKIQRPQLSREEFRASIPQSARPKRFDTNRQMRLRTEASATGSKVNSPEPMLNTKVENQLQAEVTAMQHDSQQDIPNLSPTPNGHSNEHHLVSTNHLFGNSSNGVIGLEKYPGSESRLPAHSKLSNPTPNTLEFLSCKSPSIQLKPRSNIYDTPPNGRGSFIDQAQANQKGKDGSARVGAGFPDKDCVGNALSKIKSIPMLSVRLEEKESQVLEITRGCSFSDVLIANTKSKHGLTHLRDAENIDGVAYPSSMELLDDTDRELLRSNQNNDEQLNSTKTPTSGSKHPRISTDHESSASNEIPFTVDDDNRVFIDDFWDESPPKKRRVKRKNRKTRTKNDSLLELTMIGDSKLGAEGSQNKMKLAGKEAINLPRRLPGIETELVLIPDKFDDLNLESLTTGQAAELSDDPISQIEEEQEVFAIEHHPRGKMIRIKLKKANPSQNRFQIIDEMAGLKPKSLQTYRSSEVTSGCLKSYCDGFEGKEAVPIGRFMPVRTQGVRRRRERQLITCFPSLVLVTEKSTQESIQKDKVTRRLRKHKSELISFGDVAPNHVSHCPRDEDIPILMNEEGSTRQFVLQPQTSISTEMDEKTLPLKNSTAPAATELALSDMPKNHSRMTRSSPLKHKLIRNQYRRASPNELIIPKLQKVGPPFGLQLHSDETMRLSQQAEMGSKMRSVPKSPRPVLYDLQLSQELMSVSIQKRISQIQSDNTSSENGDDELSEESDSPESQKDVTEEEKDIFNNSSEWELDSFYEEKNEVPHLLVAALENIHGTDEPSEIEISDEESMSEYAPDLYDEDINAQEEENSETDPSADSEDAECVLLEQDEPIHDDTEQQCGKMMMSKVRIGSSQQIASAASGYGLQVTSSEQLWGCIEVNAICQTPQLQENLPLILPNNKNDHHLVQVFSSTPILNPDSSFRPQNLYSSSVFIEAENEIEEGLTPENKRARIKRNNHMATSVRRNPRRYKTLDLVKTRLASPLDIALELNVEASWDGLPDHLNLQSPRDDSQGSTILGSPRQNSRNLYHIFRKHK